MSEERDERRDDRSAPETSPLRDRRGRFIGCGNPRGRPRKIRKPSHGGDRAVTFGGALVEGMAKTVQVRGPTGKVEMSVAQIIVQKLLNDAMSGNATERAKALRLLFALSGTKVITEMDAHVAGIVDALNAEPPWTDDLEADYQRIVAEGAFDDDCTGVEPTPSSGGPVTVRRPQMD